MGKIYSVPITPFIAPFVCLGSLSSSDRLETPFAHEESTIGTGMPQPREGGLARRVGNIAMKSVEGDYSLPEPTA